MWKHVLPPVVTVIGFWLVISLTTNIFIWQSDRTRQRILNENVASIVAASDLKASCWKLISMRIESSQDADGMAARIEEWELDLAGIMKKLRDVDSTTEESENIREIEGIVAAIQETVHSIGSRVADPSQELLPERPASSLVELSEKLITVSTEMRKHNRQIINENEIQQRKMVSQMMLVRNFGVVLGPIVGILVGWRLSSRLQRHVSTLAITLLNAASSRVVRVGEVSLVGKKDLQSVQALSELVVGRMKQALVDLERAEQEVIQSERLAAVGELAAGIAHELRNPLTSVKLLLQHAITKQTRDTISLDNFDLILREIARMEETIQGLLDFSRPPKMVCSIHDIRAPLQRAVTLVNGRAASSGVEIRNHSCENPAFVNGDSEQLHLVFVNLLINAVESIESGGVIDIYVKRVQDCDLMAISFCDTGCGIDPQIMNRLFEPFVTSKEHGTGLGLALCHRVIANHQGTIVASNRPQGGAVFELRLPTRTRMES